MDFQEIITNGAFYLTSFVGGCSLVVAGLGKIAKITPSTKDDDYVGAAARFIGKIAAILDRLALNPDETKARKK